MVDGLPRFSPTYGGAMVYGLPCYIYRWSPFSIAPPYLIYAVIWRCNGTWAPKLDIQMELIFHCTSISDLHCYMEVQW